MITTIPKGNISAEKQDAYIAKAMAINMPFGNIIVAAGDIEALDRVFDIMTESLNLVHSHIFDKELVKDVAIVNYNKTTDEG